MAVAIKVPDMGESIIEATIARWLKQPGDPVKAGEALVELETDKVSLEVSAEQPGLLQRIEKADGETVAVGDVLAWVETAEAPAEAAVAQAPTQAQAKAPADAPTPQKSAGPVMATPVAQRMAQEMGIDLSQVKPTGSGGRVTKEDVQAFTGAAPAPVPVPPPTPAPVSTPASIGTSIGTSVGAIHESPPRETRQRMSRRRLTIARRLVEAQQTAAMLTTFNEIDMSAVIDLRKRRREGFKERYGVDLGFMPFFVKACIGALKAFPLLNAEIQGDEIVLKSYYDIGVAIGADDGLVVPVIRDADRLNFAGIERSIRAFVTKAKEGSLSLEDLRGGTFTITNGGVYGSLLSTPILNPPQVGILGMHAIQQRPIAVKDEITIRPMMYVALSYDHRIVDGREAVQFLVRVKELIEDPENLLFG